MTDALKPEQFSTAVEDRDGVSVVRVSGELDVYTAVSLQTTLDTLAVDDNGKLVVDLTGLGFMDSAGLGVLIGTKKRIESTNGSFAVVCAGDPVMRLLSITGLIHVLNTFDTVEAALAGIADPEPSAPATAN
jgi:anti-sigma B factor antagonist